MINIISPKKYPILASHPPSPTHPLPRCRPQPLAFKKPRPPLPRVSLAKIIKRNADAPRPGSFLRRERCPQVQQHHTKTFGIIWVKCSIKKKLWVMGGAFHPKAATDISQAMFGMIPSTSLSFTCDDGLQNPVLIRDEAGNNNCQEAASNRTNQGFRMVVIHPGWVIQCGSTEMSYLPSVLSSGAFISMIMDFARSLFLCGISRIIIIRLPPMQIHVAYMKDIKTQSPQRTPNHTPTFHPCQKISPRHNSNSGERICFSWVSSFRPSTLHRISSFPPSGDGQNSLVLACLGVETQSCPQGQVAVEYVK